MNDLITMSIQGGRYLEAEKQIGDIILSSPSADSYFMLGTVKSNLLLDKGRSYLEVQFCFNKYLELSEDKSQSEKNIMAFCVGLYSQLADIESKLLAQKKKQVLNIVLGTIITFDSSKTIDNSEQSFGVISGVVGASFGVGMVLDGLSNIGDINAIIPYVIRLKVEMIEYLKKTIDLEKGLLESEILTLGEKYGSITNLDNSIDKGDIENVLGSNYVSPTQAIAFVNSRESINKVKSWTVKGFLSSKPFELPKEDKVLFGLKSDKKPNLMEYLFTNKGVYHFSKLKLMTYDSLSFKTTLGGTIGHNLMLGLMGKINNQEDKVKSINDFVSKLK